MHLILSCLLSFLALDCCAQINLINRTVVQKDANVIFEGMSNELVVTGTKSINWRLKATYARITPAESPRVFYVEADTLGTETFTLLQEGKPVLTRTFKVIYPPDITIRWGVIRSDSATPMEVIANKRMIISMPGSSFCPGCRLIRFKLNIVSAQYPDRDRAIEIEGNTLTPEAAGQISKLTHGDRIVFNGIRASVYGCARREGPGFTLFIK